MDTLTRLFPGRFIIVLDKARGTNFHPGESITGKIVLETRSDLKTSGLRVCLRGKASTDMGMGPGGSTKHRDCYRECETFLQVDQAMFRKNSTRRRSLRIKAGETTSYAFAIQLPETKIPSSFSAEFGEVEYSLKAFVKQKQENKEFNSKKVVIYVISLADLDYYPEASLPGEWFQSKTFGHSCCSKGPLTAHLEVSRRGHCPGDKMIIESEINNQSGRRVTHILAYVNEYTKFHANSFSKMSKRCVMSMKIDKCVQPGDCELFRIQMEIPNYPIISLVGCDLIERHHVFKMKVFYSGSGDPLVLECPVFIGHLQTDITPEQLYSSYESFFKNNDLLQNIP